MQTGSPLPKALVVDDDQSIRQLLMRILERNEFQVDSAKDGFEAIEKLAIGDYQVVLLDLMMPRVDGFGVIDFLRRSSEASLRKVIVLTASHLGPIFDAPVAHVMMKPIDIHQLVTMAKTCSLQ